MDPLVWAQEANDIATSFVYEGITEDEELPQKYIDEGKAIAERQLVIAGHRLYQFLKDLKLTKHTNAAGNKFQNLISLAPVSEEAFI